MEYVVFYQNKKERFDNRQDAILFTLWLKRDNIEYTFISQSKETGVW